MDFQRIILVGIIAITSYMIVLQWQKDYRTPAEITEEVTSVSSQAAIPDTLIGPSAETTSSGDIPTETTVAENIAPDISKETSIATQGKLINVKTDLLDVLIDPYGGDIIHAELQKYLAQLESTQKFVLLEQNDKRIYTAQSGLTGRNGPDASGKRPQYNTSSLSYELNEGEDSLNVDLTLVQDNGVEITKRFIFTHNSYDIIVQYLVNNKSSEDWQASMFGQLKRDRSSDPTSQTSMGMSSYLGPAFSNAETPYKKVSFDDIDDGKYANKTEAGWAAMLQHYFVSAWIPNDQVSNNYFARERNGNYFAGFVSPIFAVAPGQQGSTEAKLYVGPKVQSDLQKAAPNLELTVDFGWLWFIAEPLFHALLWVQSIVINWGLAIILITVAIKVLFFYPSAIAYKSMAKMRTLGPEMQRLKDLYGDDRQKISQAMMELYKKEKINPLGGCLPMLIQMPVFISLYWVLMESVQLRHAPFVLWINDLSVMDPYFVLPILMGISMFIQQMLNPTPPDPMQAKVMKMLPIIFTIFFLWFPAGLVVYWLFNNILSIAQQWVITRQIEAAANEKKAKS